jgi:hypothetical protein
MLAFATYGTWALRATATLQDNLCLPTDKKLQHDRTIEVTKWLFVHLYDMLSNLT